MNINFKELYFKYKQNGTEKFPNRWVAASDQVDIASLSPYHHTRLYRHLPQIKENYDKQ